MKNHKISIITVCYNAEDTIADAIKSVLKQNYSNLEYIIIDGASTDNTLDIIKKNESAKALGIEYIWISEQDNGVYDAMNKGIDLATGDYVYFLGADDCLYDNILNKIFIDMYEKKILIYGNIKYETGEKFVSSFSFNTRLHNTIHHQSAFYHRDLFREFRYDSSCRVAADYELNLIIFLKYKNNTIYIKDTIALCSEGGLSRRLVDEAHSEMMKLRRQHFNILINLILDVLFKMKLGLGIVKMYFSN